MAATLHALFASLADPTRAAIVDELVKGDRSVNELVGAFRLGQPAISKHLKVLESAGLVRKEAHGNRRICRLNPQALSRIEDWAAGHRADWEARLDNLGRYLDGRHRRS